MVEALKGASIQHGKYNDRIYLMKLGDAAPEELIPALEEIVSANEYTKIFAKIPSGSAAPFLEAGYQQEAKAEGFYNGTEDAVFLGKYFDETRASTSARETIDKILAITSKKEPGPENPPLPGGCSMRVCKPEDGEEMAAIYRIVFESYPFPIHDPDYIRETMRTHVVYFCIEKDGKMVALSSAETDRKNGNVEMTDFATLPEHLGNGYAFNLLREMEVAMRKEGLPTAYTIARAVSPGMNITFAKAGYTFGGTLINNTNISGGLESMNIWYKPL